MRSIINIIILSTILCFYLSSCKDEAATSPTNNTKDTTSKDTNVTIKESFKIDLRNDLMYNFLSSSATLQLIENTLIISTNQISIAQGIVGIDLKVRDFNKSVGSFNNCEVSLTYQKGFDLGLYETDYGTGNSAKVVITKFDSNQIEGTLEFTAEEVTTNKKLIGSNGTFTIKNDLK